MYPLLGFGLARSQAGSSLSLDLRTGIPRAPLASLGALENLVRVIRGAPVITGETGERHARLHSYAVAQSTTHIVTVERRPLPSRKSRLNRDPLHTSGRRRTCGAQGRRERGCLRIT